MAGRFSPAYRLLRDAVDDRTYGQPQVLELELRSALLWPGYDLRSDTIVLDMLHGELDTLVRLLGMPETTATATVTGTQQGSAVQAIFTYPDAIARVSGSALMPRPVRCSRRVPRHLHRWCARTHLHGGLHRPGTARGRS
jgi:predicted dehydrogenase